MRQSGSGPPTAAAFRAAIRFVPFVLDSRAAIDIIPLGHGRSAKQR